MDNDKYIENFNRFYDLQKSSPELCDKLLQSTKGEEEIMDAMRHGAKQAKEDIYNERMEQHFKDKSQDKTPDYGR